METAQQLYWCKRDPVVEVSYSNHGIIINTSEVTPNYTAPSNSSADHLQQLSKAIDDILAGPILAGICIFGVFGNVVNLLVLCRKAMMKGMERMEKSAHMGLIALAVADMCFCLAALPSCFIKESFLSSSRFSVLYQIYSEGLVNMFLLTSTWLTVNMAVSRYVAICHPLRARLLIGKSFAKGTIVVVFLLSVAFNVPRFLESSPRSIACVEGGRLHYWVPGPLSPMSRPRFKLAYQWLYFILGILLPLLLLVFCNVRLIQALRNSRQMSVTGSKHNSSATSRKNSSATRRVTLTLVIIVVMYLVLVSPAEMNTFLRKMAIADTTRGLAWYNIAVSCLNTLQSINFAFNFVLYCAVNTYFRRTIQGFFCKCRRMEKRSLFSFRSMTNSTKLQLSSRNNHTYVSEMSTMM